MSKRNETLIDEANRIIENECRWKDGCPIVNVKDFGIKFMQLSWTDFASPISFSERDIAKDSDKKEMVGWMMQDAKSVKILPLIITSNIFILVVLAVISRMLSSLIEKGKPDIDKIEIDFLVGKGLINYSKLIKDPFDENYSRIIPDCYMANLPTVIEINVSELKSLLNILILSLEIKEVDLRKIINRVNHTDIKNYCRENVTHDEKIERTIMEWTSKRRDMLQDKVGRRVREVTLNKKYNITEYLLKIVMSVLHDTDNKSRDKFILIVANPVKEAIKQFFNENTEKMRELKLDNKRLDDIMFVSYTDPADPEDPEVIVESIPSYLTILSKYINSQEIVYAIDEYFHSKMMDTAKSRKFRCEKFHANIEKEETDTGLKGTKAWKAKKEAAIQKLSDAKNAYEDAISSNDARAIFETELNLKTELTNVKDIYVYIQKKELEVINDGFLTVQNDILEQLKLIL